MRIAVLGRRALAGLGGPLVRLLAFVGALALLLRVTGYWLARGLLLPSVRLGRRAICAQLVRVGVRAVGVVAIVAISIGMILALQMAPALEPYGQTDRVATFVAIAVFRELGPLMSAIVLSGFAGASIAAELGTMVVGEEIEAMETHALDPVRFLVVPRLLATTLGLLGLTVFGEIVAVGSGWVIGVGALDIPSAVYLHNTTSDLALADFVTGMAKAGVFGLLLGAIACERGLSVTGGAAGVGEATTQTVVYSVLAIILTDVGFTAAFYALGWQ